MSTDDEIMPPRLVRAPRGLGLSSVRSFPQFICLTRSKQFLQTSIAAISHIMASLGSSVSFMRSFTPRLSKEFFTCRQCLGRSQNYATKSAFRKNFAVSPFPQNTSKLNSPASFSRTKNAISNIFRRSASGSAIANAVEEGASNAKSSFPKVSDKTVAYWLLGSAASVFGIVVFGGLTRLTESGCAFPQRSILVII